MGRHGIPARVDDRRASVREARRPLRPQDRPADGDRDLPRRLGALRAGAGHGPADRLSCAPGNRRRRPDRDDHGRRRRHRAAARARQVPGAVRCRLRRLDGDRPAARRLLRRPPLVALDLLHQPAARDRLARGHRSGIPSAGGAGPPRDRLPRRGAPRRRALGDRALHEPRRDDLGLGIGPEHRPRGDRRRVTRRLRVRRATRRRADPAADAVRESGVHGHQPGRLRGRVRALRRDHVPPALPADRQGARPDRGGAAVDADDGRGPRDVDRQRSGDQSASGGTSRSRSSAPR